MIIIKVETEVNRMDSVNLRLWYGCVLSMIMWFGLKINIGLIIILSFISLEERRRDQEE